MPAFSPSISKILSVSATSALVSIDGGATSVRIYNAGPNKCFVRWGTVSQTAVATDMALMPDSVEAFEKGTANSLAAICSANESCILYITPGFGV